MAVCNGHILLLFAIFAHTEIPSAADAPSQSAIILWMLVYKVCSKYVLHQFYDAPKQHFECESVRKKVFVKAIIVQTKQSIIASNKFDDENSVLKHLQCGDSR